MAHPIIELLTDLIKEYPTQEPQIAYLENNARGVYVLPEYYKTRGVHHKELANAMDIAGANGAELAVVIYTGASQTPRLMMLFKPRPKIGDDDA